MNREIKEEKGKCKVCGTKTKQIFNIGFMRTYICKQCEYLIVKQSVMEVYRSKNTN